MNKNAVKIVKLSCGHETRGLPTAKHPDGRSLYECPVCKQLSYGGRKRP